MLFKGKQITCQIEYESEKYTIDLERHRTVGDLYIAFQDKIQSKDLSFIILFSPDQSNSKEFIEIKNLETTLISLEKDKNDILYFQFLKAFKCPSCLLFCDNEKKYINKYCIECDMYICIDCSKDKKHSNHYLIDIDFKNLKDSIKLWNINLNAELSEQITNFNKQMNFITDDLDKKIKIWIDELYKKIKTFEMIINTIKLKTQELKYYIKESENRLNIAMSNLTKTEQEINIELFTNEKAYFNIIKYLSLEDAETYIQKLKNNYIEISSAKKSMYNIISDETIKKWEEMTYNIPKSLEEMFKATDLVINELNIYETKCKKNGKKETNPGRRKKTDLYLSGNLLFKTSNDVQVQIGGTIRKKNKNNNIYIMHDNERKKTDLSLKLKTNVKVNEMEDGNKKMIDYTNRGIQNLLDKKKSGEYKSFDNEILNNMKYLSTKDRNRYTPKNLKLPKIIMNDKDKYIGEYLDRYRYKGDMKKSLEYNKNITLSKKI